MIFLIATDVPESWSLAELRMVRADKTNAEHSSAHRHHVYDASMPRLSALWVTYQTRPKAPMPTGWRST